MHISVGKFQTKYSYFVCSCRRNTVPFFMGLGGIILSFISWAVMSSLSIGELRLLKSPSPSHGVAFYIPEKWMIMCFRDPLPHILYHISYSDLRDWKPPFFDSTAFYFSPRSIPVMLLKLLLHFGICCVMEILKWSSMLSIWTWWMSQSEVLLLGAPLLMSSCGSQGCSLTPHSEFVVNWCTTLKRLWRPYRKKCLLLPKPAFQVIVHFLIFFSYKRNGIADKEHIPLWYAMA